MKLAKILTFTIFFTVVGSTMSHAAVGIYEADTAFRFVELKRDFILSDRANILGKKLCVEYRETRIRSGEVTAMIMDWNRDVLIQFPLSSSFGANRFVIDLEQLPYQWEEKTNYWIEIIGGGGIHYKLAFQLLPQVLNEAPVIDIVSDVKYSDCKGMGHSMVEFYGSIQSDNYPCRLEWNVLNKDGIQLHAPVTETIDKDEVSTISVLDNPSYTVNLKVQDACGNIQNASVEVSCPTFKKSKLHIYIEDGIKNNKNSVEK